MGHSLLASLTRQPEGRFTCDAPDPEWVEAAMLGLVNDIQAILGEALAAATTMFTHRTPATHSIGTLPRHLWPKSVRPDVSNIRRRDKAIRRLIKHVATKQEYSQVEPPREDPSLPLWASVTTPLSLRTALSPPPKNLDALEVLVRPDHLPMGIATVVAVQD